MKPKLKILVGPPGSGKSSLAYNLINDDGDHGAATIYVNQDSQGKTHFRDIFLPALLVKADIIVDRMNFSKEQRQKYIQPAKEAGYETEIIVLHESYDTCKERILKRNELGTHETIKDEKDMYKALNFFFSHYERPTLDEADTVIFKYPTLNLKLDAIICDIDGTAANIDHRLHYVKNGKKDWKGFFSEMHKDIPNKWCRSITNALRPNHIIIFCSGRSDNERKVTKQWLEDHSFHMDWLFMRNRQDHREDSIIKEIILDFEILTRVNPVMVIDDRQQVVDMWRKRGFVTLQCAKGDF